ncbi:hypothetical protein V070_02119 [Staphylococcus aureus C0673]|nr:hypothetical protein V070_02119 [Staphylococcus aureus C0673]
MKILVVPTKSRKDFVGIFLWRWFELRGDCEDEGVWKRKMMEDVS